MAGKKKEFYKIFLKLTIDISVGMLIFVAVSLILKAEFCSLWSKLSVLGASICFALLPDLDYIPFFIWRKRCGWTSHWLIHYPILWIAIAALVWSASSYWAVLFGAGTLAHLLHDGRDAQGLKFLWPFYNKFIRWQGVFSFKNSQLDYDRIHSALRQNMLERGLKEEAEMRLDEQAGKENAKIIFFALACALVFLYFV